MMKLNDATRNQLLTLFTPGDGGDIPPYLAGRDREKQFFQLAVYTLMEKRRGNQNMIVYGPRGNGKTVLLRSLQEDTLKTQGKKLDILWTTPRRVGALEGLVRVIAGDNQKTLKKIKSLELSASVGFAGASASVSAGLDVARATAVAEDLLRERCKKKPFVLIMDEAHTLPPEMGGILLDASQNVRGEGCPFFLALAGTPGLVKTLNQAKATFWDRGEEFPLGRLSVEESVEALVKPLEPFGIPFADGVAEEVANRAHCYPFFLQVWGKCLMEELVKSGQTPIDRSMLVDVQPQVTERAEQMYAKRFTEIDGRELLPIAGKVARAFIANDNEPIPTPEINALVRDRESVKVLERLGYIWQVTTKRPGQSSLLCYEPGIPSLMHYVKSQGLSQINLTPPEKKREVEVKQKAGVEQDFEMDF